ncbi:MAG: hypothetical protein AAFP69_06820 [Planctomycetota bacterium]
MSTASAESTKPQPAKPQSTKSQPTKSQSTESQSTESQSTESQSAESQSAYSGSTNTNEFRRILNRFVFESREVRQLQFTAPYQWPIRAC